MRSLQTEVIGIDLKWFGAGPLGPLVWGTKGWSKGVHFILKLLVLLLILIK